MAKFSGPKAALEAAQAPDATTELLRDLAASEYPFVRAAVARHPATEIAVLEALLPTRIESERDVEIGAALASNPRTPAAVLAVLGDFARARLGEPREAPWAFDLGVRVCLHPGTPAETLRTLFEAPRAPTQFRKVVARDSGRSEIRELAARDRSETVRQALTRPAGQRGPNHGSDSGAV